MFILCRGTAYLPEKLSLPATKTLEGIETTLTVIIIYLNTLGTKA